MYVFYMATQHFLNIFNKVTTWRKFVRFLIIWVVSTSIKSRWHTGLPGVRMGVAFVRPYAIARFKGATLEQEWRRDRALRRGAGRGSSFYRKPWVTSAHSTGPLPPSRSLLSFHRTQSFGGPLRSSGNPLKPGSSSSLPRKQEIF